MLKRNSLICECHKNKSEKNFTSYILKLNKPENPFQTMISQIFANDAKVTQNENKIGL